MEKVKIHENPGKELQNGMRRYGGGRKSMKEEEIETSFFLFRNNKMKHHENPKSERRSKWGREEKVTKGEIEDCEIKSAYVA